MGLCVDIQGTDFILHASGAVYWPEAEILLIADVHLGKISHFRKFGSAVPVRAISSNFDKLDLLIKEFDPEHIVFLGDLFHSSINQEWLLFEDWHSRIDCSVVLIAGNHDLISPLKYEALDIPIYQEMRVGNFLLTHHPESREGRFNICGHIHPGFKMRAGARQVIKLPCFFQAEDQLILPAFGEFTGNYFMKAGEKDRIFAIAGKEVILVN